MCWGNMHGGSLLLALHDEMLSQILAVLLAEGPRAVLCLERTSKGFQKRLQCVAVDSRLSISYQQQAADTAALRKCMEGMKTSSKFLGTKKFWMYTETHSENCRAALVCENHITGRQRARKRMLQQYRSTLGEHQFSLFTADMAQDELDTTLLFSDAEDLRIGWDCWK